PDPQKPSGPCVALIVTRTLATSSAPSQAVSRNRSSPCGLLLGFSNSIFHRSTFLSSGYSICENGNAPVPSSQIYSFSTSRVPPGLRRIAAQNLLPAASAKQTSAPLKLVTAAVIVPQSPVMVAKPSVVISAA